MKTKEKPTQAYGNETADNQIKEVSTEVESCPLWEKVLLTVNQASQYSGIGINTLRDLTDEPNCKFVFWIGTKRMIKRKELEQFIGKTKKI